MEHRTDEGHEGFGAAADEETRDEATEAAEGEVATALADEDDDDVEEPEVAPEQASVEAAAEGGTTNGTAPAAGADHVELYTEAELEGFRERWETLLAGFVDDPRAAAEEADELIGELVDAISRRRQQLHDALEGEDDEGETEAMRQAILRYRAIYRALVRE
jgi:hypothetical protein